jgi:uncharacterized protein YdbL (DUF1318 family)
MMGAALVLGMAGVKVSAAEITDLDKARAEKLVTELPNGFLKANAADAKTFVDKVNAKRKQHYEEIAKKNGITVEQVGVHAAQKIQEKIK